MVIIQIPCQSILTAKLAYSCLFVTQKQCFGHFATKNSEKQTKYAKKHTFANFFVKIFGQIKKK